LNNAVKPIKMFSEMIGNQTRFLNHVIPLVRRRIVRAKLVLDQMDAYTARVPAAV
jgi:hypothetical protein